MPIWLIVSNSVSTDSQVRFELRTILTRIELPFSLSTEGIVYCLSQKDAEDVCVHLQEKSKFEKYFSQFDRPIIFFDEIQGIKAGCYHAGLSADARSEVHEKWIQNQILVICATIAFGKRFSLFSRR